MQPIPLQSPSLAAASLLAPAGDDAVMLRVDLDEARRRDWLGDRAHLAAALIYAATLPLATAPNAIAFGILVAIGVLRLPHTFRCYRHLLHERLLWLLVAWAAWHGLSVLWSHEPRQGLNELGAYRVVLLPLLLWPVIDRATWLVGSFLVGVAIQNGAQVAQWLELMPRKPGDGDRLRGFIHPIQTGAFCAAAICWHLCGVLRGGGWVRWLSLLGLIVAGAGLVFTGSRGPWIAAVAAPVALVFLAIRRPAVRRRALEIVIVAAVATLAMAPLAKDFVTQRYQRAVEEFQQVDRGKLRRGSDVAFRLASWNAAWQMFLNAPLQGAGAGSFERAAAESQHKRLLSDARHAHSTYLHIIGCTGAVGAVVFLALVLLMMNRGVRGADDDPPPLYADGHVFVLLTWLVGGIFDAYQLNGLLLGLFALLVTLLIPLRFAAPPPASPHGPLAPPAPC